MGRYLTLEYAGFHYGFQCGTNRNSADGFTPGSFGKAGTGRVGWWLMVNLRFHCLTDLVCFIFNRLQSSRILNWSVCFFVIMLVNIITYRLILIIISLVNRVWYEYGIGTMTILFWLWLIMTAATIQNTTYKLH